MIISKILRPTTSIDIAVATNILPTWNDVARQVPIRVPTKMSLLRGFSRPIHIETKVVSRWGRKRNLFLNFIQLSTGFDSFLSSQTYGSVGSSGRGHTLIGSKGQHHR